VKKILLLSLVLAGCPDPIESDTDPVVGAGPAEELAWSAPADGLELQGTLTLPERDGPVPVVVLVHGSGPNGRDAVMAGQFNMGFGFELRAFEQIAAGLQERGVAVYRYDKRTCVTGDCAGNGYPTPSGELLVDDFVADGVAAAASLTASEAIDPSRIWIAGHSQGGQLVPAMVRDGGLAGGIVLAGNHDPIDVTLRWQLTHGEDVLRTAGYTDAQITSLMAPVRELADGADAIRDGTWSGGSLGGASEAFWRSWMDAGDAAPGIAASLEQPLVVLAGDYDWNVPPGDVAAWEATFAGNPGPRSATLLPCVTHALNCIAEPDFRQIAPGDVGTEVDARILDAMAAAVTE